MALTFTDLAEANAHIHKLRKILFDLNTNPHLCPGDLVYHVRDDEGEGWDGPAVRAWGDAVTAMEEELGFKWSKYQETNRGSGA